VRVNTLPDLYGQCVCVCVCVCKHLVRYRLLLSNYIRVIVLYTMCIYDESMHHESRDKAAAAVTIIWERGSGRKTRRVHLQRARGPSSTRRGAAKKRRRNAGAGSGEQTRITSAASARAP